MSKQERIYGPHKIDDSKKGRQYCQHRCGCYWSRTGKKGGPIGLDPIESLCPNNPQNCERLPSDEDHKMVVKQKHQDFLRVNKNLTEMVRHLNIQTLAICGLLQETGFSENKVMKLLYRARREAKKHLATVARTGLKPE